MSVSRVVGPLAAILMTIGAAPAVAQDASANREAVSKLAFMHGVWVGEATGVSPNGQPYRITQTERIGPMLGGEILVIEGRGYEADGSTAFNAFAVVSWDAAGAKYEMRSYALGRSGTFPFALTEDGYVWEIPAGPGVVRYQADVTAETFHEVGDFVMEGQPSRRMFEMTLTRRADTDWPAAEAVDPAL